MASDSILDETVVSWTKKQHEIARQVNYEDENDWSHFFSADGLKATRDLYIAGADISFSTAVKDFSVATFTIVKLCEDGSTGLVYSQSQPVIMQHPYVATFLGFRESPVVSHMLSELPPNVKGKIDCLLTDGNGVLHPRKAGLACQVGVEEGLPTVGVSKNMLFVDGITEKAAKTLASTADNGAIELVGDSGFVWGTAVMAGNAKSKPIYVSVGHRVSLATATKLVQCMCEFRIPSPIRFADMHSRALLRGEKISVYKVEEFPSN